MRFGFPLVPVPVAFDDRYGRTACASEKLVRRRKVRPRERQLDCAGAFNQMDTEHQTSRWTSAHGRVRQDRIEQKVVPLCGVAPPVAVIAVHRSVATPRRSPTVRAGIQQDDPRGRRESVAAVGVVVGDIRAAKSAKMRIAGNDEERKPAYLLAQADSEKANSKNTSH